MNGVLNKKYLELISWCQFVQYLVVLQHLEGGFTSTFRFDNARYI